ncbi:MAG: DPP IV N-terminal domain-containing protein, partial [Myxococcales bacterium]|nr:DPP IV N-terminal domain-containing protein [Myxococcales bacterium]
MLGPARIALIVSTLAVVAGCSPVPGASVDAAEGGEGPTTKGAKVEDDRNANPALTLEEVATYPKPGTLEPNHVAFSPDDATISYLESPDKSLSRELIAFDPATGARTMLFSPPGGGITEDNLSREEKLRRERQRVRGLGVTTYAWAKEQPRLLVPQSSSVYVQDGAGGTARELLKGDEHPILDPQLSRDGAWVAYVHDDELHVIAADGKSKPRQLTEGARGTGKTHGLAEYIAQEEMHRSHGFWWSWDASMLAFTEVDETHIPVYRIVHQGKDETGDGAQEDHRYPFAGRDNAKVRLGVVKRTGGEPVWMDLTGDDSFDFEYLARVHWMPDGRLLAQLEDRAQQVLRLVSFDPKTGASRVLLHERSDTWINLQHAF